MGKLVLLLADGTTLDVPLGKERITIGRRADNDVCLPHPAVSGEHASVVTILADSFLEDLGSTNGTLVNGKPIVKHFLRDHDQIDIGRQRMVFVSDDNAHVDPLPPDPVPNHLLGLTNRVDAVHPAAKVAVPSISNLRTAEANPQVLVFPELDGDAEPQPPPAAVSKRQRSQGSPFADRQPPPARREADQRLAAWAAEWAAPSGNSGAGPIDTSAEPVAADRSASRSKAIDAVAAPAVPAPSVRVLSGPNLGRTVPFTKDELSLGRVGVQVALIRKVGTGFLLVPVEGAQPPRINGAPIAPEGAALHPGDTFEVAGVRLELSLAG